MTKSGRRPLMAGNWKMNLNWREAHLLVQQLAARLNEQQLTDVEVVVLPPFVDLRSVQAAVEEGKLKIGYGSQDISQHAKGAYTGEIAGSMLTALGCTYAVMGHSERRQYHSESDEIVNAKVQAALASGLTPIMCVGEGLDIREAGNHVEYTVAQLDGGLKGLTAEQVEKVVVAYEPVWAIGTGKTATPEDAQEVIGALRKRLAELYPGGTADKVRILYGGSVKGSNAAGIMAKPDIDGALVGGAALDAEDFSKIVCFSEN
ncbi:MAG: triose-phosphate isomerase [Micromonosporaceae bacterium]|nr:triose-phosphate isomerase [Micromonosporaceae bacterium]